MNEQCPPLTVSAVLPEALGEGVGRNLQLCDPWVLVGCHGDEHGFREAEGGNAPPVLAAKLGGPHQVYTGLILVHGVQDQLGEKKRE